MNNKKLYVLLGACCLLLGGLCFQVMHTEDKEAPQLQFPQEMRYTEGDAWDTLLAGVTASDAQDGDVTDNILVESVTPDREMEQVVVVYVVKDEANNVTKVSKKIPYLMLTDKGEEPDDDSDTDKDVDSDANPTVTPEPTKEPTVDPFEGLAAEAPRITLKEEKVTIEAGKSFNKLSLIKEITDDEDDQDYLWKHIQIDGDTLDTDKKGTYVLVYTVVDSGGRRSNEAKVEIVVE